MACLIIYDSLYGNTQKIADAMANVNGCNSVRIQDFKKELLEGVLLLIVGCPIHGWQPSKPTLNFLSSLPPGSLKGIKVAAYDTRIKTFFSGSASDKVNKKLVSFGGVSVAPPGKFFVKGKEGPLADGEMENAKNWFRDIMENENI